MAFGDDVAQRGWQTGSVLPAALLPGLAPHLSRPGQAAAAIGDDDWLLVVSQTCDIVASKFEAEPFVEVLHAHRREGKPRKEFVDLRSTRQIDFRPNPGTHKELVLTAHAIGDRYIVPREWFTQHDPDPARRLSVDAARRLLAWYALRAARPSWPDELERRLRGAKPALLDALNPLKDDIAEVRVAIDERDEELPAAQPYHLVVFFVVDEEVWDVDVPGRAAIYDAFTRFVAALAGCDGIEVNTDRSEVVSGAVFTWQETRATDEWNFANLSAREP